MELWPRGNLYAAFDAQCGICQSFAASCRKIAFGTLIVESAQQPQHPRLKAIPLEERLHRLHAITDEGQLFEGFVAVDAVLSRTIIFPLWKPVALMLKVSGLADPLYRFIADRRGNSCSR